MIRLGDTRMNSSDEIGRRIEQYRRSVNGLRRAVYGRTDTADEPGLLERLAEAEAALNAIEQQRAAAAPVLPASREDKFTQPGRFLGPTTTGLSVEPKVQ